MPTHVTWSHAKYRLFTNSFESYHFNQSMMVKTSEYFRLRLFSFFQSNLKISMAIQELSPTDGIKISCRILSLQTCWLVPIFLICFGSGGSILVFVLFLISPLWFRPRNAFKKHYNVMNTDKLDWKKLDGMIYAESKFVLYVHWMIWHYNNKVIILIF